jgi:MOSC domain-containing protein YiiM
MNDLFNNFSKPGRISTICLRPARLADVRLVDEVMAIQFKGLTGDRYHGSGARQVTLIASEDLRVFSSFMDKQISPELVRRNIVTEGNQSCFS